MSVVSSFSHVNMDPGRLNARGMQLLRGFLEYAASGGTVFSDQGAREVEPNHFEKDVEDELARHGLSLVPQFGASGYRLDLAVRHPEYPGAFVLAIECDGASYHSAPTARDRDRLRQEQLEARGWRFVRIWSTDWFNRREEEVERVLHEYRMALAAFEHPRATVISTPPEPPALALTLVPPARHPKSPPYFERGLPIQAYSMTTLLDLVHWITSDGLLRTDDELFEELMLALGFSRRGSRITEKLRATIAAYHQAWGERGRPA